MGSVPLKFCYSRVFGPKAENMFAEVVIKYDEASVLENGFNENNLKVQSIRLTEESDRYIRKQSENHRVWLESVENCLDSFDDVFVFFEENMPDDLKEDFKTVL